MAIMCPDHPREYDQYSGEDRMFDLLSQVEGDYYVFHSMKFLLPKDEGEQESETDFYILHREKGIIAVEAKAGSHISYDGGDWRYGNGSIMRHDGPFNQAQDNMHNIMDYITLKGLGSLLKKCKVTHAVWFPDMSKSAFKNITLPPGATMDHLWLREDNDNLVAAIEKTISVKVKGAPEKTTLSEEELRLLLDKAMAPRFDLVSISELESDHRKNVFKRLLDEQVALLNYLEEQKSAVISGMAGTGKTVIAHRKAEMHAVDKEKVLFLCYNIKLQEHLSNDYPNDYIDYYTIDGYGTKICGTPEFSFTFFEEKLYDYLENGGFLYRHVIIDEGQDFDPDRYGDVIEILRLLTAENEETNGSFYLFYDKHQRVQAGKLPKYISEADCKLTLYRNCRNTENIALTSLRLIDIQKKPKMIDDGRNPGDNPDIYFVNDREDCIGAITEIMADCETRGYSNLQLLTCKTIHDSILAGDIHDERIKLGKKKLPITTCRKFKGLEADVVILVDVGKEAFLTGMDSDEESIDYIYYVGASRARYKLFIIASMTEDECRKVLEAKGLLRKKSGYKQFANTYNANAHILEG